ncbi:MAG: heme NO-binding domain-containing protein [Rhodobacterales bacterium]|nr:heme NO-binding domain-containing protein [Rhodobacterales bacterium]
MHGLINRSIQSFLRDTYGAQLWLRVAQVARLNPDGFEAMLHYDDRVTAHLVAAASQVLSRPQDTILEDLGTYLVSHPNLQALRRLLRFGGVNFRDFLHSLEDLPDRGHLALPDLDLPALTLTETGGDSFVLTCRGPLPGAGHVVVGLLRAMADDYGALVLIEHQGAEAEGGAERIAIQLTDARFSPGKRFDLAAVSG